MTIKDDLIRTRENPDCYVCGTRGEPLYHGLSDRLFSAPGEWDLKKCLNPQCGLVWLDPMPIEEDIGKAYQVYYTHADSGDGRHKRRGGKELFRAILTKSWNLFLRATPIYWERKQVSLMYLDKDNPGRLLEVGCGNGRRLAAIRSVGWQVEGQEVDLKSIETAQQTYGLKIHYGSIDELKIPDGTFDAIIMSHVIEHVHHPEMVLAHCHRLLKPGGKLVVVTPNIGSFGHRYFGADWLALDPPRHLHIFSCKALQKVAHQAGFSHSEVFTAAANAQGIAVGSLDIQRDGHYEMGTRPKLYRHIASVIFQLWAEIIHMVAKKSGEECVLKAMK
ncbi:MAG: class I SAM-dependent methyltransferase [Sedimenticola sp.]